MTLALSSRRTHVLTILAAVGSALGLAVVAATAGPLVLLPLLSLVVVYAVVRLPGVVLGAYLLIPFYKGMAQGFVPVDLTVILAVANVASLAIGLMLGERLRVSAMGMGLWALLSALVAVGTVYAPDRGAATQSLIQWMALVAVPLLSALRVTSTSRGVHQLAGTLFAFGCLMVVVGILTYTPAARIAALGTNTLGVSRAALLVPILTVAWAVRGPLRVIGFALTPPAVIVALATGSRAPIIALAVMALAWGIVTVRRKHPGRAVALAVVLVLATVGALALIDLPQIALARFDTLASALTQQDSDAYVDTSIGVRLKLYDLAWSQFLERPLFGWGTDAFLVVSGALVFDYPHSLLLEMAADLGIVGASVVVALIVVAVRGSRRWPAIFAVLAFTLLNNVVGGAAFEDRLVWGMLLVGALALQPDGEEPRE